MCSLIAPLNGHLANKEHWHVTTGPKRGRDLHCQTFPSHGSLACSSQRNLSPLHPAAPGLELPPETCMVYKSQPVTIMLLRPTLIKSYGERGG